jgi:hypothetical protein
MHARIYGPSFGLVLVKSGSINSGTEERELSSIDFGLGAVLGNGLAITLRYYSYLPRWLLVEWGGGGGHRQHQKIIKRTDVK